MNKKGEDSEKTREAEISKKKTSRKGNNIVRKKLKCSNSKSLLAIMLFDWAIVIIPTNSFDGTS